MERTVHRPIKRVEQVGERGRGYAGPAVDDGYFDDLRFTAHVDGDLRLRRRVFRRILDQVVQRFADLNGVQPDGRQVGWHGRYDAVVRRHRPQTLEHIVDQRRQVVPALVWAQAAALDARQVEQV